MSGAAPRVERGGELVPNRGGAGRAIRGPPQGSSAAGNSAHLYQKHNQLCRVPMKGVDTGGVGGKCSRMVVGAVSHTVSRIYEY